MLINFLYTELWPGWLYKKMVSAWDMYDMTSTVDDHKETGMILILPQLYRFRWPLKKPMAVMCNWHWEVGRLLPALFGTLTIGGGGHMQMMGLEEPTVGGQYRLLAVGYIA